MRSPHMPRETGLMDELFTALSARLRLGVVNFPVPGQLFLGLEQLAAEADIIPCFWRNLRKSHN